MREERQRAERPRGEGEAAGRHGRAEGRGPGGVDERARAGAPVEGRPQVARGVLEPVGVEIPVGGHDADGRVGQRDAARPAVIGVEPGDAGLAEGPGQPRSVGRGRRQ